MNILKKDVIIHTSTCIILLIIATMIGMILRNLISGFDVNIVLIYMLAVLMSARLTPGYIYGIVSSIVATFVFNYFFTAPFYTFSVYDSKYIVTFLIMTLTSIIMSASTSRIQESTQIAKQNEMHMKTLYELASGISDALDQKQLAKIIIQVLSSYFHCEIGCICFDKNQEYLCLYGCHNDYKTKSIQDIEKYKDMFSKQKEISDSKAQYYAISGMNQLLGIIILPIEIATSMNTNQKKVLYSMIENISLALDHIQVIEEQLRLKEETVKERYRGDLLRSISHDLRTPLSGIMGISEMIMGKTKEKNIYDLAKDIYSESNWLYLMVENILSLTRVQEGKLVIHKQLEAIEEIIGSAVYRIQKNTLFKNIEVEIPEEIIMVAVDAQLIQQVLINLLDNAVKHTPKDQSICITVKKEEKNMILMVEDYGEGFKDDDTEHIFEMFYTDHMSSKDASKGVGLGLTICKAIIEAHDGRIEARNCTTHQGAQFVIMLPLEESE